MGRVRTITRRVLLVGSLAVAGGVAFGGYLVARRPGNPIADGGEDGDVAFNPWVLLGPGGITLITPHADVGQGTASMQAALIAEEMDLGWGDFQVSFGPPADAYWNTALASEMVPFLPWDQGAAARAVRAAAGGVMKVLGVQATGGSSSVPDSFDKLRAAGAMARETLKLAASNRSGVPVADLRTEGGAVFLPDGTRIDYTDLAADAGALDPVRDTPLRDASQWRLIGKPMPRLDIVAKSTGAQKYGIDLTVPGMVHAAVTLNPGKGGAVNSIDDAAARAMPGVRDVVPISGGAAVIAGDSWTAMQGARAVVCDWGPAPYAAEQADHWQACADAITDDNLDKEWLAVGDPAGPEAAGDVVEAEYRAPYLAHQPMEPLNAIVRVDADLVEVWTGHQMPRFLQAQVAAVTGHDAEQVVFHNQMAGGSFGHRLEFDYVRQAAEIAAKMPGTPVKLTLSREQDFAQDYYRPIGIARGRGTVRDGQVRSFDIQIAGASSSRSQGGRTGTPAPGADGQLVSGVWNQPYVFAHARVRAYAADPARVAPSSSWRSVGASSAGFFGESLLDELIHAAGADPLAERIRLCQADPVSRKVLEAVGEMADWAGPRPGDRVGRGVAMVHSFGVPCAEIVEVRVTDAGLRLTGVWVAADVGRVVDPVNFENQVQGGVIWGLGHAMNCQITFAGGAAQQHNFNAHGGMRIYQCPPIHVRGLENGAVRGIGEPPVPPAAPALAGAIFAATGQRLREMPFDRAVVFA